MSAPNPCTIKHVAAKRHRPEHYERLANQRIAVLRQYLDSLSKPDPVLERVHTDLLRFAAGEKRATIAARKLEEAEASGYDGQSLLNVPD